MPNEPVQCPNCGGGNVRQLATDSYACEHCQTDFHWVNPTKITVTHEQKLCACGRVAVGFCCRCGRGLCQTHGGAGTPKASKMSSEQLDFYMGRPYLISAQYKGWMEKLRIPEDEEAIVCSRCISEFKPALDAVRESRLTRGTRILRIPVYVSRTASAV